MRWMRWLAAVAATVVVLRRVLVAVPVCLVVVDATRDVGPLGGSCGVRDGHGRRGRRGRYLVGQPGDPVGFQNSAPALIWASMRLARTR